MSIVDSCVERILKNFQLPLSDMQNRDGLMMSPIVEEEIEAMNTSPRAVEEEGEEVLGYYEPMASPGRIVLELNCLNSFFWHHARDVFRAGYYIDDNDLRFMCHMVVLKTYTHEQFHHFCDVARHLFGGSHDHFTEEALAVAWSYFQLEDQRRQWQSKEARLSAGIYRELLPKLFCYRAPGYRDWVNFRVRADFEKKLIQYTGPASSLFLEHTGIDVSGVLVKILETTKLQGVVEEVAYK